MKKNLLVIALSLVVVLIAGMCLFTSSQVSESETEIAVLQGTQLMMEEELTLQAVKMTENVPAPIASETQRLSPTYTSEPATGTISGSLSYPSEFIPALRIVAFEVVNNSMTGTWYSVDTELNQFTYQMDNLPAGQYYVVAYMQEAGENALRAGYTQYVLCGLSVDCTDHSLIAVEVMTGAVTAGVDPGDWYVDPSNYPPDPSH